jgi:hypothetical protein
MTIDEDHEYAAFLDARQGGIPLVKIAAAYAALHYEDEVDGLARVLSMLKRYHRERAEAGEPA